MARHVDKYSSRFVQVNTKNLPLLSFRMNFGIMRGIALVLLIVAARDAEGREKFVSSVKLRASGGGRIIGAINFWQPAVSRKQITMYCNLSSIPDGTYIAVVHKCIAPPNEKICTFGPALAETYDNDKFEENLGSVSEEEEKRFHQDIDIMAERYKLIKSRTGQGRRPLTLFRTTLNGSTDKSFLSSVAGVSLVSNAKGDIAGSFIAIYRDTPSGLKLCSKSQNNTAKYIAWGYMESSLIGSGEPEIPDVTVL